MKMAALMLVVISLISMMNIATLSALELRGPRIEVKEYQHDFGRITDGQHAVHVFEIRNAGDEPLEIRDVKTS